jgi:hypothetical protein
MLRPRPGQRLKVQLSLMMLALLAGAHRSSLVKMWLQCVLARQNPTLCQIEWRPDASGRHQAVACGRHRPDRGLDRLISEAQECDAEDEGRKAAGDLPN